jgi:DNA-binding MarR family transcriptional regulator/GNAT superfamily N-acetyltransferase
MSIDAGAQRVAAVRGFNRFYTNIIGVLGEGLLRTPYSLAEARVIFELAQRDRTEVTELRRSLDLDAGYLSRILARFAADGLITRERSTSDGRRQIVALSDSGRAAFSVLDSRSAEDVGALLGRLTAEQQRRLIGAMETIRDLLGATPKPPAVELRPLAPGDVGWVVHRHGVLYAEEYEWDETFEALVARILADYVDNRDPRRESAWIAEVDGAPVGCVFCMRHDEETAQLRLLLVEPGARGSGVGGRLVEECIRFARQAGYRRMMLWTNDVLTDARRLYERAGFTLAKEEKHHSYGHDLVGQDWWLDL